MLEKYVVVVAVDDDEGRWVRGAHAASWFAGWVEGGFVDNYEKIQPDLEIIKQIPGTSIIRKNTVV